MSHTRTKQTGAVYVEAAIVMPILILVTFASAFLFLCAARQVSVQMLANEIAKDLSLALRNANFTGISYCINNCKSAAGPNAFSQQSELDLTTYQNTMYGQTDGCWNSCARNSYLLATSGTTPLQISVTPYHLVNWYDETPSTTYNYLSPGDFFTVKLRYPFRAVWGGGIAMFGIVPADKYLTGTAVGVMEKRG